MRIALHGRTFMSSASSQRDSEIELMTGFLPFAFAAS